MFESGNRVTPNPEMLIPESLPFKEGELYTVDQVEVQPTGSSHERSLAFEGNRTVEVEPRPNQGHELLRLVEFPGRQFWAGYFVKTE